jgi:ankyrin repeat protein
VSVRERVKKMNTRSTTKRRRMIYENLSMNDRYKLQGDYFRAAYRGNLTTLIECIHNGVPLELIKNGSGYTVLHYACMSNHIEIVKYLIVECQINVNAQATKNHELTALHCACKRGNDHLPMIQYLCKQGHADIYIPDGCGAHVLHMACIHGHMDIVKYLIEDCHMNIYTQDNDGSTALHYASQSGCIEVIKYLIEEQNMNINVQAYNGFTLLHSMFLIQPLTRYYDINNNNDDNNIDIILYLIHDNHIDLTLTTRYGENVFDLAFHHKYCTDIVVMLLTRLRETTREFRGNNEMDV